MTSSFIGKVLDNYRILGNLGEGGMGMVFKAVHIQLDKVVAIKMISAGMSMNKRFIDRFQTEARALAKLEDPNIVAIHDLRSDNDLWFIVMEYVDGPNFYDRIKDNGAIPWRESTNILKQMLSGLGHAHRGGIVHRDIKPNNIMLTKEGVVKITDFGLAKDQASAHNSMTVAGGGTLYYMSPEHVKGFSFTDKRSDIYSIGMTYYEMITGKVPFENINTDFEIRETIIRKDIEKPTTFNSDIPIALEEIVMKSIAKNPDERYQSCEEMLEAVQAFELENGIADDSGLGIKLTSVAGNGTSTLRPAASDNEQSEPGKNKKALRIFAPVAILFSILLSVIFYPQLFSSEKVTPIEPVNPELSVSSSPGEALVRIDGDSVGQTPIQIRSLSAGTYALKISKEKYSTIDTTIVLENQAKHNLSLALKPILEKKAEPVEQVQKSSSKKSEPVISDASVSVRSNPNGAKVWLDGKSLGQTPFKQDKLRAGLYQLKLSKDGFQDFTQKIRLTNGKSRSIDAKLVSAGGALVIKTEPSGAKVSIDGQVITNQSTPVDLKNILEGVHQLKVQKQGYAEYQQEIEIKSGETMAKTIDLVQLNGMLNVRVIPWGSIYIDGKMQKSSSDVKLEVELSVGEHTLKVVHPTLGEWRKEIEIKESQIAKVKLNFNKKIAMNISAADRDGNALDGDIYIDGKNSGQKTPAEIKLNVGIHRLNVKKLGYSAPGGEVEFLVDPDSDTKQMFSLKKQN